MGQVLGNLTNAQVALPGGGAMTAPQAQNTIPNMPDPTSGLDAQPKSTPSTVKKPSFLEAMDTGPGGTANIMSPELSTKGKILTTLLSGAFGALAGAGQKTVGEGFQQGSQLPWQQAQQRQATQSGALDLQQKQLQNQYFPQILAQNFRKTNAEIDKNTAEAGKNTAEAGAIPTETALKEAQTLAARYKEDPASGALIDLKTQQPVNGGQMIPVQTPELANLLNVPVGTSVPLARAQKAATLLTTGATTLNTEQGVFDYNRITGQKKKLGDNPRNIFAPINRIIPVADPNNPGQTTFMKAGDAVAKGAAGPQSASVQVPKTAMKAAVPTKIGDLHVALDTMINHAALLREATHALANGDMQTLNGLKNKFKTEFGSAGPITATAIADAYKGEVSNVINKGHITDVGNERVAHTLEPNRQNYAQMDSVLSAYQSLAQSKMANLDKQAKSAVAASQPKGGGKTIHYKIVNGALVAQ